MLVGYSWGAPRGLLAGYHDGFGLGGSRPIDRAHDTLAKRPASKPRNPHELRAAHFLRPRAAQSVRTAHSST